MGEQALEDRVQIVHGMQVERTKLKAVGDIKAYVRTFTDTPLARKRAHARVERSIRKQAVELGARTVALTRQDVQRSRGYSQGAWYTIYTLDYAGKAYK
jgi:hypothetical protein